MYIGNYVRYLNSCSNSNLDSSSFSYTVVDKWKIMFQSSSILALLLNNLCFTQIRVPVPVPVLFLILGGYHWLGAPKNKNSNKRPCSHYKEKVPKLKRLQHIRPQQTRLVCVLIYCQEIFKGNY